MVSKIQEFSLRGGTLVCIVIEGPELTLVNFDKMLDIFKEK